MRALLSTIIIILFLASCQSSPNKTTKSNETPFDLSTLPKDWTRLTKTDSGLIIYNSCDGGNLLITITNKEDKFGLLLHGQQEDEEYDITAIQQLEENAIILKTTLKDSEVSQDFKFQQASNDKKLGRWSTTYPNGFALDFTFVTKDKEMDFRTISQPCRECWGDECDEMEKSKNVAPEE